MRLDAGVLCYGMRENTICGEMNVVSVFCAINEADLLPL